MGSRIRCFSLELSDQVEMTLRRFSRAEFSACPASDRGYHNAEIVIGRSGRGDCTEVHGDSWPHADPRWPKQCACGYVFTVDDDWQFNPHRLYRRADTGELVTLGHAPAGAMWNAYWLRGIKRYKERPDGIVLLVRTPGGDWAVDGPSSNGNGWERTGIATGAAPTVDVNPSIIVGSYHGFLRHGWLEEC